MRTLLVSTFAGLSALVGCASPDPRTNVSSKLETPAYSVVEQDGAFEVRRYAPYIVAQTRVQGDRDAASRAGFRILAGYIFGKNKARKKVAMTAPVVAAPASQRIAMTAPVAAEPTPGGSSWLISFMMPSAYTLATLPVPDDDRVTFAERPARCHAAVVFSGLISADVVEARSTALTKWAAQRGLQVEGPPVLARYNDPWTLPMNRRNEFLVQLKSSACDSAAAAAPSS